MTYSLLGFDADRNRIEVGKKERLEHMYVIGSPGKGKSVLLQNGILQDIEQNTGIIVIDPNRDLITSVIATMPKEKLDQVVLLDITNTDFPFSLNLYECSDPTSSKAVQYTMDRVMRIWDRLFQITRENPLISNHMRNAAHLIIVNPGYTLADIPLIYYDEKLRKKLVANVKDIYVKKFWENFEHLNKIDRDRQVDAVLNKFTEYVQPMILPIVGQSKSTIHLRELMDAVPRKIILLQLDPQLQATDSLIGGTLLAMILQAAFSRGELPPDKRKQVHIYCDEGDYFATKDMQQLVNEGRKYGIGMVFCHQSRVRLQNEVPEFARSILGAATTVVFQSAPQDCEEVSGKFDTTPPVPEKEEIGVMPILTYKREIIKHLTTEGHQNQRINDFFTRYNFGEYLSRYSPDLSDGFYQVMVTKDVGLFTVELEDTKYIVKFGNWQNTYLAKFLGVTTYIRSFSVLYAKLFTRYTQRPFLGSYDDDTPLYQFLVNLWNTNDPRKQQAIIQEIRAWYAKAILSVAEFQVYNHSRGGNPWPRLEKVQQELREESFPQLHEYLDFILEFRTVLQLLADDPIMTESGQFEIKYKLGSQKTHQEIQNEITNQLSGLPKLTARVKLNSFPPSLKSKICHRCKKSLAAAATACPVCEIPLQPEYVMTVPRNEQRVSSQETQARTQQIIEHNVKQGYLRPIEIVEEEMRKRHEPDDPSAGAPVENKPKPPNQPPQPRRRKIE